MPVILIAGTTKENFLMTHLKYVISYMYYPLICYTFFLGGEGIFIIKPLLYVDTSQTFHGGLTLNTYKPSSYQELKRVFQGLI